MRNAAGIVNTSGSSNSWPPDFSIFMKKRGEKVFSVSGLGPALAQYAVDLSILFQSLTQRAAETSWCKKRNVTGDAGNAAVTDL